MAGRLSVEIGHTPVVGFLRARGILDPQSASDLRDGLLQCLAEQPDGVVVDATDLTISIGAGLEVLAEMVRENERWPRARFVLAGPTDEVLAAADRGGITSLVVICPDVGAAMTELSRWPEPPRRRVNITPDRDAPSVARAAVQQFCSEQRAGTAAEVDSAQLLASELVTNAVVHTGTPIDLTLRLVRPLLYIGVRDRGSGTVQIRSTIDESAERGRGLLIVDAFAFGWGSVVLNSGKVVWATALLRGAPVPRTHRS